MSDLIKRYGYDRAKRELKAMDDRSLWMISSCLKLREEVRQELLDYEHNSFGLDDLRDCDIPPCTIILER